MPPTETECCNLTFRALALQARARRACDTAQAFCFSETIDRLQEDMRPCLSAATLTTTYARSPFSLHVRHARALSNHANAADERVRRELRALLRETAQPVAVITSLMPKQASSSSTRRVSSGPSPSLYHGATLSSFSSIAMDPHPLVAFSLRIPSRMATTLKNAHHNAELQSEEEGPHSSLPTHMVVNVLAAHQADVAVQFARPDLYPRPFEHVAYTLTKEGLPVLSGSLGALSCRLVAASWPLHDLHSLKHGHGHGKGRCQDWKGEGVASELFIAQVVRVEDVGTRADGESGDERARIPLLYYSRGYTTTGKMLSTAESEPGRIPPK